MRSFAIVAVLLLCGCVKTFQAPITGQTSSGQIIQGAATASTDGKGSFWIATVEGLKCSGVYNSLDRSPTISIGVSCNDGRTGNILATRELNGFSGTGTARLSDGTSARFVFGDLTFSQNYR